MITEFLENIGLAEWVADAISDSIAIIPFLFVIFVLIELFEFYFSDRIRMFMRSIQKSGPFVGSFISIIPQCGFSVIASTLYVRKFITGGTLIAIYIVTSDEAIPILLANPGQYKFIIPIVLIKLAVAIPVGYIIDFIFKPELRGDYDSIRAAVPVEDGCCRHDIFSKNKKELIIHPIKHTLNIFAFILLITLVLNFFIDEEKISNFYQNSILLYRVIQPVVTSLIGLIPNCAVSLAITVLLMKGTISFGAAISGLMSNAGLGLLVLLRSNNMKDNLKIIGILLFVSILCGEILQLFKLFYAPVS